MREQYDFTGGMRGKYYHAVDHGFDRGSAVLVGLNREIQILGDTFRDLAKSTAKFNEIARTWAIALKRAKGRARYRRAYDRRIPKQR